MLSVNLFYKINKNYLEIFLCTKGWKSKCRI